MTVSEYIRELGYGSLTDQHELIEECLERYNVHGIKDLLEWQLKEFCKEKSII